MKYKLKITNIRTGAALCLAAVMALAQWSCSRDQGPELQQDEPVELYAGIATRTTAGGNHWAADDRIGVFMVENGDDLSHDTNIKDNLKYRPETTGSPSSRLVAENPDEELIYWPDAELNDFIAYYPYKEVDLTSTDPEKINDNYHYPVDITDQSEPEKLDILYAKETDQRRRSKVTFTFEHLMARMRINLVAGDGVSDDDLSQAVINMDGMPTKTAIDLSTGLFAAKEAVHPLLIPRQGQPGDSYSATFEAVVIPQYPVNGFKGRYALLRMVDGSERRWNMPDDYELKAGYINIIDLTVSREQITFSDSRIIPWEDMDSEPGTVTPALPIMEEANSYILFTGGVPVLIPVSQANKAADAAYNLGADATGLGGVEPGNYSVEKVWADTPIGQDGVIEGLSEFAIGDQGYVLVKYGGRTGNAVIAIRDKESGTIKWSWHIWVLSEKPGSATDPGTGLTWMDRNLGAAGTTWNEDGKNGLYYQWGRKDAFPEVGLDPAISSTYNTLSQLVQNPGVFTTNESYTGSVPNTSPTTNPSWGESGQKTIYDPCPPGWRVPPIEVGITNSWGDESNWDSFVNNGRIFKGVGGNLSIYFPAAGARYASNGQLYYPGSHGYYWFSSSASGTNAWRLTFYSGAAYRGSGNRHGGFSVRCVAE